MDAPQQTPKSPEPPQARSMQRAGSAAEGERRYRAALRVYHDTGTVEAHDAVLEAWSYWMAAKRCEKPQSNDSATPVA